MDNAHLMKPIIHIALVILLISSAATVQAENNLSLPSLADGRDAATLPSPCSLQAASGLGPASCTKTILCGTTERLSFLGDSDSCLVTEGSWVQYWEFEGTAGDTLTIDMSSSEFDTFLRLYDPNQVQATEDDDGGSGTDSRIEYTLDRTGTWTIEASSYDSFGDGDVRSYHLSVACVGDPSQPPAAPANLIAQATYVLVLPGLYAAPAVQLDWQDNSDTEDGFEIQRQEAGGSFISLSTTDPDVVGFTDSGPFEEATEYTYRVRARNSSGDSAWSNQASATPFDGCLPTYRNHCLNQGRFNVEVRWRNRDGYRDAGRVVPLGSFASPDSGLFWFFSPDNWEMLVKVLDGCTINQHFWVFVAATTDVEYTLRVTDTESDAVVEYFNPLGNAAAAITDTQAFATCP